MERQKSSLAVPRGELKAAGVSVLRFVYQQVYRAQAVSYDWVPTGTPRCEMADNAPVVGAQQTSARR